MNEQAATVIYAERATQPRKAPLPGDGLWLTTDDLTHVSGWELKPEGICRGDLCVPVPPAETASLLRDADGTRWVNLATLAEQLGMPVVHDAAHAVWSVGEAAATRGDALSSLTAPDFTLPDLDGRLHSLHEQRGKKVVLNAWASW